ncbi:hypothetical protein KXD93_10050 [Mucilaginibacter sp. BJC16-A38]|uniref:hypothetical protein n=1 Tax=Mucilaginibacter phenanthrenivorans TaxID=1234842 RepID=UPI00215832E8|nr:hypothetical protein [Mucilaginibacter phenanthrenivorans]MCR8557986.1 hypothetical protein [Mucilaginibacter phenanthrenivorans]
MKRPLYTLFIVIYQLIICWVLIILNAYYNDLLIPAGLLHAPARVGMKILIALAEGAILILIAYAIDRASLSDAEDDDSRRRVASKTCKVQLIITACFILAVILR